MHQAGSFSIDNLRLGDTEFRTGALTIHYTSLISDERTAVYFKHDPNTYSQKLPSFPYVIIVLSHLMSVTPTVGKH
jgi:hypothetical protein